MTARPSPARGFTKRDPGSPPGAYRAEAAGLAWLAEAGREAASVVDVVEVGAGHITVERLTTVRPTREAAEAFGRALWRTHSAGADAFGSPPRGWTGPGFIGVQSLSLRPAPSWGAFYAEQRVMPYAQRALDGGTLSRAGYGTVERVAERLIAGEYDDQRPPARIHGDLWSGNVVFTGRGVVLIDPAAHGGHGLTDIAMLMLFGSSHLDATVGAYAESADLGRDWRALIALHQLHPLLVHAVSHGAAYGAEAARRAAAYA